MAGAGDRRRRGGAAVAVGVAAVVLALGCGESDDTAEPSSARLGGCWMTVHLFRTEPDEIARFVPAGYRLGTYFGLRHATLAMWTLACDRVAARGRPAPAVLSLVGVQVASPLLSAGGGGAGPAAFHHYLLGADTDSPALRAMLRAGGQPVRLVAGLRLRRGGATTVVNPAPRGGYTTTIRARALDRPHSHRNLFWFGPSNRRAGFELSFASANDRYCQGSGAGCTATASAPRGSRLFRLLGGRDPAPAATAFDHLRLRSGRLAIAGAR